MNQSNTTLPELLLSACDDFSERDALTMKVGFRMETMTYREMLLLSKRIAVFLREKGIKSGDKVLLHSNNSPYLVCVMWGILLNGSVIVPINLQSTKEQIALIAQETEARVLFTHRRNSETYDGVEKIFIEYLGIDFSAFDPESYVPVFVSPDDVCEIMYTSGTTGDPKGVVLTHRNIITAVSGFYNGVRIYSSDRFLSILPLSHIFEQVVGMFLPISCGAQVIYAHSPSAIRTLMREYKVTIIAGVPEFLEIVMKKVKRSVVECIGSGSWYILQTLSHVVHLQFLQRLVFWFVLRGFGGKLRFVVSGGAPLSKSLEQKWNGLGVRLLQGYGMTETSAMIAFNRLREHKFMSVGKVPSEVRVKIADDGEILVKGDNVFREYYNDPEVTKKVFNEEGYLKTGDIGELDSDGYLFLKGRKKYMILSSSGQNVYPEDIELKLNGFEDVRDSCVVGLTKASGQTEIHAVLLLEQGDRVLGSADIEKIISTVNSSLASYQRIGGWSLWDKGDFPRSHTKKVKKKEVERWLQEGTQQSLANLHLLDKTLLMTILSELTGTDVRLITEETKIIADLSMDSLLRIELVSRIEEEYGVMVNEAEISLKTRVRDLQTMVDRGPVAEMKRRFHSWTLSWWSVFERATFREILLFPLLRLVSRVHVEGLHHLEKLENPVVFLPNHVSHFDSAYISLALPSRFRRRLSYAAAQDVVYENYRVLAPVGELLFNCFPFPRKEGSQIKAGLEYMGQMLDQKWSVVLYPEGELSASETMLPLKAGAGIIAISMNAPIVPIRMHGVSKIFPNKGFFPRGRKDVRIVIGEPMRFDPRVSLKEAQGEIEGVYERLV